MIIKNDSEVVRAAVQKITDGTKDVKGSKENFVKEAVRDTLCSFCQQSEEFARAVTETSKCLAECLTEIMKDAKNGISDFEVYRRAVAFFMEGAEVHAELRVILPEAESETGKSPDVRESDPRPRRAAKILSLEDLW